jgi:carbon storage regulator
MLMLTRKEGQRIFIGDDIVITIGSIFDNKKVRIGIEAPKDIKIRRDDAKVTRDNNELRKCPTTATSQEEDKN